MKRLLLLMLTLCAFAASQAQVRWNAEAAVGSSTIINPPSSPHGRFAYRIGGGAIIPLNNWFSLRPSLYLAKKGVGFDGYYGKEQITEANYRLSLNYLELPVMAGFDIRLKNGAAIVLKIGPFVSYGLNGKVGVSIANADFSKTYSENLFSKGCTMDNCAYDSNNKLQAMPKFNRLDAGVSYGVAYEMRHFSIGAYIDLSLTHAASSQLSDDLASALVQRILTTTDKPINLATGVHVGYIF